MQTHAPELTPEIQAQPTQAEPVRIEVRIRRLETPAATASTPGRGLLSVLLGKVIS